MKEYKFKINGNPYSVNIDKIDDHIATVSVNNTKYKVEIEGMATAPKTPKLSQVRAVAPTDGVVLPKTSTAQAKTVASVGRSIHCPLPGVVLDVKIKAGDDVKFGDCLLVLEAMKMENNIDSDKEGIVKSVHINKGDSVLEGELLVTFE